jgi:hypothetical protein
VKVPDDAKSTTAAEYREAMLRGASLAWEERWEAAATAYRRALAARPRDSAAERQLALVLSRGAPAPGPAPSPAAVTPPAVTSRPSGSLGQEPRRANELNGTLLGRTASAHLGELSELPRETVRSVIESLQAIERDQAAGRYNLAFERTFALLQQIPLFLPLHILLAELYLETGQWQAARDKLATVEAAYRARAAAGQIEVAA